MCAVGIDSICKGILFDRLELFLLFSTLSVHQIFGTVQKCYFTPKNVIEIELYIAVKAFAGHWRNLLIFRQSTDYTSGISG